MGKAGLPRAARDEQMRLAHQALVRSSQAGADETVELMRARAHAEMAHVYHFIALDEDRCVDCPEDDAV